MGGVLINGVSIYPSPGDAATPPTPSEEQISAHSRLESAGADFAQNRDQGELQEAQQNLAELMLERPEIEAARWINEQELQLVHRDGSIEMIIITDEGREPDDDRVSAENEALENMATGLRRTLTENYTVMAGATYLLTVTHANAHSFRERIEELRTSTESEAMKLARLQAWTGQRNAAADLLYNQ
jgi:hypothetical protein